MHCHRNSVTVFRKSCPELTCPRNPGTAMSRDAAWHRLTEASNLVQCHHNLGDIWMRLWPCLPLLLVAHPAYAGWQFTRWGMSPEQVQVASNGQAPMVPPKTNSAGTIHNVGPYASGDHKFVASYNYTDRRLASVSLETNTSCGSLKDDLKILYGDALKKSSIPVLATITNWVDLKKQNAIMLMEFSGSCTLIYSQYNPENRKGL